MRHRWAAAIVALGLLVSGCAGTTQDVYPDVITTLDVYELEDNPSSAIQYTGNANIFFGEVMGHDHPRKVIRVNETGDGISYIYTPIRVKVIEVFKGERATTGAVVTVRALGGRIGREMTVGHFGLEPDDYQKGMRVYFFTPDFLDAGDGLIAATPNFVYAVDTIGNVYSMRDPEQKAPAAEFPMRISEYIDWTYPRSSG